MEETKCPGCGAETIFDLCMDCVDDEKKGPPVRFYPVAEKESRDGDFFKREEVSFPRHWQDWNPLGGNY